MSKSSLHGEDVQSKLREEISFIRAETEKNRTDQEIGGDLEARLKDSIAHQSKEIKKLEETVGELR